MIKQDQITTIMEDNTGHIWIGTSGSGIFRYKDTSFTKFSQEDGIGSLQICSMLQDRSGIIWIGTAQGIYSYNGERFNKILIPHNQLPSKPDAMGNIAYDPDYITSIFEDKSGRLWLGSLGYGVYRYDSMQFTFFHESKGLNKNLIQCIIGDRDGIIWFGTRGGGLWNYDGNSFKNFRSATVNNNHIIDMLQDDSGNLWFSMVGAGVRCYVRDSATFFTEFDGKQFRNFGGDQAPCLINVSSMLQDHNGNILLASDGRGLCIYDGKSFKEQLSRENGLNKSGIRCIMEDSKGNIWIGTRNRGIYRYNGKQLVDLSAELK